MNPARAQLPFSKHCLLGLLFGISRLLGVFRTAAKREQLRQQALQQVNSHRPDVTDESIPPAPVDEPSPPTPPSSPSHWGQSPGRALVRTALERTTSCDQLRSSYSLLDVVAEKLVVVMVGLPARGKSFLGKAITRHLNWFGCRARVFNAGNARRKAGLAGATADYYNPANQEAHREKEQIAMDTLDELINWIELDDSGSSIGIFDATNTTIKRRASVLERVQARGNGSIRLLFVESKCTDESILQSNYQMKLSNEDYRDQSPEEARRDFQARVEAYSKVYQPVCASEVHPEASYITLVDAGRRVEICNARTNSFVTAHICGLLQRLHLEHRYIWLAPVGESQNDQNALLGGNSPLSQNGLKWAERLDQWLTEACAGLPDTEEVLVLSGTMKRDAQMQNALQRGGRGLRKKIELHRLNEIAVGEMEGISIAEARRRFEHELELRKQDTVHYRFPGGESYLDVVLRLHDVVMLLEGVKQPVVVVVDKAVLRVILAYFNGVPVEQIPSLPVTPEQVIELQRNECGFTISKVDVKPLNVPRRISRKPTLTRPLSSLSEHPAPGSECNGQENNDSLSDPLLFADRESQ